MSRIGKSPIPIPSGVEVDYKEPALTVKGPKGELSMDVHHEMKLIVEESEMRVERPSDHREHRSLHGLTRSLIANMVTGVTAGFEKTLEIVGVGYKADKRGSGLVLSLGFSHTIDYPAPDGISLECPQQTVVVVHGIDKQIVGQVAAEIRAFRPPEPYKGKGVRYRGEQVRRKAGKTASA